MHLLWLQPLRLGAISNSGTYFYKAPNQIEAVRQCSPDAQGGETEEYLMQLSSPAPATHYIVGMFLGETREIIPATQLSSDAYSCVCFDKRHVKSVRFMLG